MLTSSLCEYTQHSGNHFITCPVCDIATAELWTCIICLISFFYYIVSRAQKEIQTIECSLTVMNSLPLPSVNNILIGLVFFVFLLFLN